MSRRAAALLSVLTGLAACGDPPPPVVSFERIGSTRGFRFRHELPAGRMDNLPKAAMGGFAVLDVDSDGLLDIYFVNGGWHQELGGGERPEEPAPNRLLRNLGDMRFQDVSAGSGADDTGFGMGACVGDFDNDGSPDLFVSNYGRSALLRNRGDGTFEDVTEHAGITPGFHAGAAFLDYDRDGLLDLFVSQYVNVDDMITGLMFHGAEQAAFPPPVAYTPQPSFLYRNRGDGTFEDVTAAAGIGIGGRGMGLVATDLDDDGWIDVLIANDSEPNVAWRNKGDGTFVNVAPAIGMAYGLAGDERASMGVTASDFDGDGRLDYAMPDTRGGALYVARETWFTDRAQDWGLGFQAGVKVGWTDVALDADLDGDIDIYKVHGDLRSLRAEESFLVLQAADGAWERVPEIAGTDVEVVGRGGVAADFDNDGLQDIVVLALADKAVLLRNRTNHAGSWVRLRLEGRTSNRMALGARITGTVDGRAVVAEISGSMGYISAGDPRAHFGLGRADEIENVRVRWPTGEVEELGSLAAGRDYVVVEGQGVQ